MSKKLKRVALAQDGAERFGRLIFYTIRKNVRLKGSMRLKNLKSCWTGYVDCGLI